MNDKAILRTDGIVISNLIYTIRGKQVMIDNDLAELYQVEMKRLNEQVNRNKERFPSQFMFQLTKDEFQNVKSQIATSSGSGKHGDRRTMPYAFTAVIVGSGKGSLTKQDIATFNAQYGLTVKTTNIFHDRFLIIDDKEAYLIGASLKDAGKKSFGVAKIEDPALIESLIKKVK